MKTECWLYLEPYTFIFGDENEYAIYNSLSGAYKLCPDNEVVRNAISLLNRPENGYCCQIKSESLHDTSFQSLVEWIRESFSGDLVERTVTSSKPFIFKPMLFFNTDIRRRKEKDLSFLGSRIVRNLSEVTVHLPASTCGGRDCVECTMYSKQMNHCAPSEGETLSLAEYVGLFDSVRHTGVSSLNLVACDIDNDLAQFLLSYLKEFDMKKSLYIRYSHLPEEPFTSLPTSSFETIVIVHENEIDTGLRDRICQTRDCNAIQWMLTVSGQATVERIERLGLADEENVFMQPYYNGHNFDFFKEFVCYDLSDVLSSVPDRRSIFRKQVLNENFFGKLIVTAVGDAYANLNAAPLGNIRHGSLKEFVYDELVEPKSWLRVRSKEPCSTCVNKYLCPSISNYELVIGKENLCLMNDSQ